jgi:predicted enzyme related to lactoylglutathione lyase
MPDNQIDYIEFPATDLPATKVFYQTVFGWKFEDYGPAYAAFNDGRLNGGFTTDTAGPAGQPLAVIYSSELEAVVERIKAAGGRVVREIFPFPGGRRFHFADPNGNELAVWTDKEPG